MTKDTEKNASDVALARHVTWVGFWINAALAAIKIVGGFIGRSSALIADGIHSLSDFLSDIIVIVMVGMARKRPDTGHAFGHGRYEALATILLSAVLLIVAIGIFYDGITRILAVVHGEILPRPAGIALGILIIAILSKEWLYHYTRRVGEDIHSEAVIANAWHHRSDSLSSIATLIGVTGAMFLGENWRVLDPIAAMVVAIFIAVVAVKMSVSPFGELLGASLNDEYRKAIEAAIDSTPGVEAYHHLRTFKSGNDAFVELHIKVDPEINVRLAHSIATLTENNIKAAVPDMNVSVTTHIEPYDPKINI